MLLRAFIVHTLILIDSFFKRLIYPTTAAIVSQSDQQPSQVDYQALLREHQLAKQNIILEEEQLTQQMDSQPSFDDLYNGI